MAKYIGRRINVGFGIEAARGTPVGVQSRQPKTDFSFDPQAEVIQDNSSVGVITDSRDSFVTKKRGEGEIGGNVEANQIGYILYALLGSVSSSVDSAGAYAHEFALDETNQSPSLTVGVDEPGVSDLRYALAMIESLTISAEEGQQATFTVNIKSKVGESTTHTVAYGTEHKLLSRHSVFKLAENLAGLGAADSICLKSFEITFNKNLFDDFCLGGVEPEDFLNQQFSIEGSFTLLFENGTYRDYNLDGTKRAARFELIDTANTIGASSNPTLRIDLPLVSFTEFDRSMGNDEVVQQTLNFKSIRSSVDESAVEVTLVNTVEEYAAESS